MSQMPRTFTECPDCGFSPLHHKHVTYGGGVIVTYKCLVCGHDFDVEHSTRNQGGCPTDPRARSLEKEPLENSVGAEGVAFDPGIQVLSTSLHKTQYSDTPSEIQVLGAGDLAQRITLHDDYISTPGAKT